jgi:hypothetical protein
MTKHLDPWMTDLARRSTVEIVPLVKHSAPSTWTPVQRAELADRLSKAGGVTITECSDVREAMGHARLSEASDWDREHAHENLESPEFQALLVQLRAEHILLVREIGSRPAKAVREARQLLGLRSGWALRIAELRALLQQTRIVECDPEQMARVLAVRAQCAATTKPVAEPIDAEALFAHIARCE